MNIENFRQLAGYNQWANRRLYAAALEMPDDQYRSSTGVFFDSLHGTLNHLLLTDRVWLKRLTGEGEHPHFLVDLTHTLKRLQSMKALDVGAPLTVQLVPTAIGNSKALANASIVLTGVDLITSPVIIAEQKR